MDDTTAILRRLRAVLARWPQVAAANGIDTSQQDRMADAFRPDVLSTSRSGPRRE